MTMIESVTIYGIVYDVDLLFKEFFMVTLESYVRTN